MMINCIAIDDEPLALEVIQSFCNKISYLQLQKTFTKTSDAAKYLRKFPVDLIFLDIQMPDINGIEFFKTIRQQVMVIFTTAYSEYAVLGFEVNAVDYLLKPMQMKRFEQACEKAKDYLSYQNHNSLQVNSFLYVRSEYALVKIPYGDIIYLETLDDYIKIHQLDKNPVLTLMSMKKMMEKLPQKEFFRIHRSYIVAISKIESVRAKYVFLSIAELPIGVTYEKKFMKGYTSLNP